MNETERHRWVSARLAAWRAGLLSDEDAAAIAEHVTACEACRELTRGFEGEASASTVHAGEHLPPSMLGTWPRARRELRGLERALVRAHLQRCAECRQDLELLGHAPRLEHDLALEGAAATIAAPATSPAASTATGAVRATPARTPAITDEASPRGSDAATESGNAGEPVETMRILRVVRPRARWWERALIAWSSVATVAAAVAIVAHMRRPVIEPPPLALSERSSSRAADNRARPGGISLEFAPRPRSLKAPAKGPEGGKVNVIPVVGAVRSLALAVKPLSIPDTSLVRISLVDSMGDTLFTANHRQWEFFPRRVLMIDGGTDEPLQPGEYALVMASLITQRGMPTPLMSRYRFELRPR